MKTSYCPWDVIQYYEFISSLGERVYCDYDFNYVGLFYPWGLNSISLQFYSMST